MSGAITGIEDHGWGSHRDWRPWVEESLRLETMGGGVIGSSVHGWSKS